MKKTLMVLAACPLLAQALDVSSSSLRLFLDEKKNGAITRAISAGGVELAATRGTTPLFSISLARTDDFMKKTEVTSAQAKDFRVESAAGETRLVYAGFAEALDRVVCTVRGGKETKIRWGITVAPKPGWGVTDTSYPRFLAAEKIGSTVRDDALLGGNAKGGVFRGAHGYVRARMPGSLVVQFACLYDDSALFYYAAEDGKGYSKLLHVDRQDNGVLFQWIRQGFAQTAEKQDYDVVMAAIDGTPAKPCAWQDAADLYKSWAVKQTWCRTPYLKRPDIPAWMKDAPAMVRFNRDMIGDPDSIRAWMKDYWLKHYPAAPLIMAYWGWERHGCWVSDYFPVYPSDEQFAALVKDCKAMNGHAFPWPSGYYWILDYNKDEKTGAFAFDDHATYEKRKGDDYACVTREGKPFRRKPRWLRGGSSSCLCGGTRFCQDWWNNEVCLPLAKLGCEMIQADQTVGGAFPPCWSRTHGHEFGEGLWKKECFYKQMVTMRETMRTCEKDSVVCFEEPCELYNDVVGVQDYRTCEAQSDEWASVFNYVYHEYLPCFQSNPRRYNRVWQSHACADGQIPFLSPRKTDGAPPHAALLNGGFETAGKEGATCADWSRLDGYGGVTWKGRAYRDEAEKHDGAAALRLECEPGEKFVQVSQNVPVNANALKPGCTYRLSAWLKTGRAARANNIGVTFIKGTQGTGHGTQLRFPQPEAGWQRVQGEVKVPQGAEALRIMTQAAEGSVVWVDSFTLEEVKKDGTTAEVIVTGRGAYDDFMQRWITLYHGTARKWLAYGRAIRPPEIYCGEQPFSMMLYGATKPYEGKRPVVFHSAWRAADGTEALVFVNATDKTQPLAYRWKGVLKQLSLKPDQILLVEVK